VGHVIDHRAFPVLFVDDEVDILRTFQFSFERDFRIHTAARAREALSILEREPVAVLIADHRMPEVSGLELIAQVAERWPAVVPIVLTGYTDAEALVAAIDLGCIHRYIAKPWDTLDLREAIRRAIETYDLRTVNERLSAENGRLAAEVARVSERLAPDGGWQKECGAEGFEAIVGDSAAVQRVVERARRVVDAPTPVLLEGETGTGKELFARAIHYEGRRRQKAFVPVNMGTLTETLLASSLFGHRRGAFTGALADRKGLFELADGGTLFLDEIGEASPALQVHLLRVLQDGEVTPVGATRPVRVDVRIIAATNRELESEVAAGRFREDLLHRLRVFPLRLPPLDERRDDVPALVAHLLRRVSARLGRPRPQIEAEALSALVRHRYRGNVRELENTLERAVLLCEPDGAISAAELFDRVDYEDDRLEVAASNLHDEVARFERERIRAVIAECLGNKTQAARRLGLTYRGLLLKMQRHRMGGGEQAA
jgi:two-component system response regulator HupR/HoxA